jgi:hypothetical protein
MASGKSLRAALTGTVAATGTVAVAAAVARTRTGPPG